MFTLTERLIVTILLGLIISFVLLGCGDDNKPKEVPVVECEWAVSPFQGTGGTHGTKKPKESECIVILPANILGGY